MPAFAVAEAVFQLAVAFVFEGCQDGGGKGDGAAFAVFGGNHLVFASALSNVLELLVYPDVPPDVYRRHERCRCTVLYDPADGKNFFKTYIRGNGRTENIVFLITRNENGDSRRKRLRKQSSVNYKRCRKIVSLRL